MVVDNGPGVFAQPRLGKRALAAAPCEFVQQHQCVVLPFPRRINGQHPVFPCMVKRAFSDTLGAAAKQLDSACYECIHIVKRIDHRKLCAAFDTPALRCAGAA